MKEYKLIGISGRFTNSSNAFEKISVTATYLNLLKNESFIPLILPPDIEKDKLHHLFSLCSAFILTGGDDIEPRMYLEDNKGKSIVDIRVDNLDFAIIDYSLKNNLPLLGICRGMQAINVHFGGSLVQHLSDYSLFRHHQGNHKIKISNWNELPEINNQIFTIYSYHHQAVKEIGHDLMIVAISEDNIIEAFINKKKNIYGIQWHLEQTPDLALSKAIISDFLSSIHH